MHLNAHAFAGASIAVAAYRFAPEALLAAVPLAVASHCVMDKIGEPRHWIRAQHTLFDGFFTSLFVALVVLAWHDYGWVMLVGAVAGNLPDIMDKRGYLSMVWPDQFPARRWWFCHHRGYEAFKPDSTDTIVLSVILLVCTAALTG